MTASVARFIESFIPENYNLFLDINRSEKTFTGNVAITGEALDNHISLHQKDLTINSVLLVSQTLRGYSKAHPSGCRVKVIWPKHSCARASR